MIDPPFVSVVILTDDDAYTRFRSQSAPDNAHINSYNYQQQTGDRQYLEEVSCHHSCLFEVALARASNTSDPRLQERHQSYDNAHMNSYNYQQQTGDRPYLDEVSCHHPCLLKLRLPVLLTLLILVCEHNHQQERHQIYASTGRGRGRGRGRGTGGGVNQKVEQPKAKQYRQGDVYQEYEQVGRGACLECYSNN